MRNLFLLFFLSASSPALALTQDDLSQCTDFARISARLEQVQDRAMLELNKSLEEKFMEKLRSKLQAGVSTAGSCGSAKSSILQILDNATDTLSDIEKYAQEKVNNF